MIWQTNQTAAAQQREQCGPLSRRQRVGRRQRLRSFATLVARLFVVLAACATLVACDGCGGSDAPVDEVGEGTGAVQEPGTTDEPGADDGSGAEDETPSGMAVLRWSVDEVSALEAVGECQSWDIADDGTVLRLTTEGRVLVHTVSSTAPSGFLSLHEDAIGPNARAINALVSSPYAFAMHTGPPPSVDQQGSGGVLSEWRFGGEVAHSQSDLAGTPVDMVRIGEDAWALSRTPEGSVVEVFAHGAMAGGPPIHRFDVGAGAVGFFASSDSDWLAVPLFEARSVALFRTAEPRLERVVPVEMRPVAAAFHGDTTLSVVSGTDDQARVIQLDHDSDGQVVTLPGAVFGWVRDEGGIIAISPATGSVWRLEGAYLNLAATHDLWPGHRGQMRPLPLDAVRVGDAIAVLDVSPGGFGVWWLDAHDLRYRAHTVLDAAPVQVTAYEGDALVLTSSDCSVRRLRLSAVDD